MGQSITRGTITFFTNIIPYDESFDSVHWGHVRSRDLVYWEHLPVALWPSAEHGEEHCYSGSTVISAAGTPMIFYTSVPSMTQWAATGDDELINWRQHSDNPILPTTLHDNRVEIGFWRDPFIFTHSQQTYMLTGGYIGEARGADTSHGQVSIYRAENPELTSWRYGGPLFVHPHSYDCAMPNLFRLGEKWVLVMSRHNPHVVDYCVGTWNEETFEFRPERSAPFEYGEGVYATHGLYDVPGRLIMWGTIHGYRSDVGWLDWPGCQTLPRVVSLRPDGLLSFKPVPELQALRGRHIVGTLGSISASNQVQPQIRGDLLEILVEIEPGDARAFGLKVRCTNDGCAGVEIRYDGQGLAVDDERGIFNEQQPEMGPFVLMENEKTLRLHLFLDKGVLEVYANDRACFSRPIKPPVDDLAVALFAEGGTAQVLALDAWTMGSIWSNS